MHSGGIASSFPSTTPKYVTYKGPLTDRYIERVLKKKQFLEISQTNCTKGTRTALLLLGRKVTPEARDEEKAVAT